MDWKSLLGTVAPILGTALGGPFGGMAFKAIAEALGLSEQTEEAISTALSGAKPEDLLKLKQADQQFAKDMKALDVDLAKLEQSDRQSARELVTVAKSYTPSVLSWLVIVGAFVMYGYLIRFGNPVGLDDVLLGRMLGTLDTAFGLVLAYWLGTSFSSRQKDATIKTLAS
jgi:hypothetical protein